MIFSFFIMYCMSALKFLPCPFFFSHSQLLIVGLQIYIWTVCKRQDSNIQDPGLSLSLSLSFPSPSPLPQYMLAWKLKVDYASLVTNMHLFLWLMCPCIWLSLGYSLSYACSYCEFVYFIWKFLLSWWSRPTDCFWMW